MRIFLATSNIELIRKYSETGIFSGVITNPHIVAEGRKNPIALFKEILNYVHYAYYQLGDGNLDLMLEEAERILDIDSERIRIKVPATRNGFCIMKKLARKGVHVMGTCVPTCAWMIFTIESGAREISPYSGMLQRKGLISKWEEVLKMQRIIEAQKYDVSLCTGIYDITELPFYAEHGIQSYFIWGKDVDKFFNQPLVSEAVDSFRESSEVIRKYYKV